MSNFWRYLHTRTPRFPFLFKESIWLTFQVRKLWSIATWLHKIWTWNLTKSSWKANKKDFLNQQIFLADRVQWLHNQIRRLFSISHKLWILCCMKMRNPLFLLSSANTGKNWKRNKVEQLLWQETTSWSNTVCIFVTPRSRTLSKLINMPLVAAPVRIVTQVTVASKSYMKRRNVKYRSNF